MELILRIFLAENEGSSGQNGQVSLIGNDNMEVSSEKSSSEVLIQDKDYICNHHDCGEQFDARHRYEIHRESHKIKSPFICPYRILNGATGTWQQCPYTTNDIDNLNSNHCKAHKKRKTDRKRYQRKRRTSN